MAMDWVPLRGYDAIGFFGGASGAQSDHPLMDPVPQQDPLEIEGVLETQNRYKILRVVGYWSVNFQPQLGAPTIGAVYVRVQPAFQTVDGTGVITAGQIAQAVESPVVANEKWWWERIVPPIDVSSINDPYERAEARAHPFSYFADFKPNQWIGDGEIPVVSVMNTTDVDVTFTHRWRGLMAH